jgi:D-alanyl-D-alanine carboxypeptidase
MLAAVVLGQVTPQGRADKAADLLAKGFATSASGTLTVASLVSYGDDLTTATDMREAACSAKAASENTPIRDKNGRLLLNSAHLKEMTREPNLITVGLGGATGPVPVAFAAIEAKNYADVPIPTWRPDMPIPGSAHQAAQGDDGQM